MVEVRQGTLGVDGRGWGPAENTVDRGSQLDEDDEDDKDDKEDERGGEEEEEDEAGRGRQEEATDIKSNNPHLAGGEIYREYVCIYIYISIYLFIYVSIYIFIYLSYSLYYHIYIYIWSIHSP